MHYFQLLKTLYRLIRRSRKQQALVVLCLLLITTAAEVISIGAIVPLLSGLTNPDFIFQNDLFSSFLTVFDIKEFRELSVFLVVSFCLTVVAASVLRLLLLITSSRLSFKIGIDVSELIFENTLRKPFQEHALRNSSEIISAVATKSTIVISGLIRPTMALITYGFMLGAIITFLLYLYTFETSFILTSLLLSYYLISKIMRGPLTRNSSVIAVQNNKLIQILRETLDNIRNVIIDKKYNFLLQKFKNSNTPLRLSGAGNEIIASSPRFIIESLAMIFICAIILNFALKGQTFFVENIGTIGVIVFAAQRILPMTQHVYHSWAQVKGSLDAINDALLLANEHDINDQNLPKSEIGFDKIIKFHKVAFKYEGGQDVVLTEVNLQIHAGDVIGIIGESGGGKSTFADLLLGLLTPTNGKITIDDQILSAKNVDSWQEKVSFTEQGITLIDASVIENVSFFEGKKSVDVERILICLNKASFPKNIDPLKKIGENGESLSGGQRQRLSIARGLYKEAKLYLFDEVTSSLDEETEHRVMSNLKDFMKGKTLIFITHRIATLNYCNRIFNVANGRVQEISKNDLGDIFSMHDKVFNSLAEVNRSNIKVNELPIKQNID